VRTFERRANMALSVVTNTYGADLLEDHTRDTPIALSVLDESGPA
jgi:hypothetical protein